MERKMSETKAAFQAMMDLCRLIPAGGLKDRERVEKDMEEMISSDYEPYFSGNAAMHLLAACQRCGRCCRQEKRVAVTIEDCRRIARHLGLSQKAFMIKYTQPHALKGAVGSARMLCKAEGEPCIFYDPLLPGCRIHYAKPQVCRAAFYLSKMNLLFCQEEREIKAIPNCPADALVQERLDKFGSNLEDEPGARERLILLFSSPSPEADLFLLLLRLKGLEIYFGGDRAERLARRLGLPRLAQEDELRPGALLYAAALKCGCLSP
jgi:Fe-S-cluster containining protein